MIFFERNPNSRFCGCGRLFNYFNGKLPGVLTLVADGSAIARSAASRRGGESTPRVLDARRREAG